MCIFQNKKRKLNNESFGEEISSYYFGLTRLIEPKVNFDEDKVKKCMEIAEDHSQADVVKEIIEKVCS